MKSKLLVIGYIALGIFYSLYAAIAHSADLPIITLTDDTRSIHLNDYLEIAADKEKLPSIEQLAQSPELFASKFQANSQSKHHQSLYWLRFRVNNLSQSNIYLIFKGNDPSDIQFYAIPDSSKVHSKTAYLNIPPLPHQIISTFPLINSSSEPAHTYYLRIRHNHSTYLPDIFILSDTELLNTSNSNIFFYALIMGAMLIVSIYNFTLFFSLREAIYATLAISILSQTYLLANMNGLYQFLTNTNNAINFNIYNAMYLIAIISAVDFLRRVLESKTYTPVFNKVLLGIILIASFALLFFPYLEKADMLINYAVLVIMPITLLSVLLARLNGRRFATSLMFVVPVYILTVTPYLLAILGLIDNAELYMKVMHMGLLIASILFSLTVAEKTRELQESRKLARAAAEAKGKLLANMSHELRTPMNATIGISKLLKQTPLNAQQRDYVNKLLNSSQHMLQLIDKLLNFSMIKANKLTLTPHDFSLKSLLDTVCTQVEEACKRKKIQFHLLIDPQSPKHFFADRTALSQVLINLTNNAVKFTEQGSVDLILKCLDQSDKRALINFKVKDTGLGMTQQQQQSIFEPFSMGNMEYSQKQGGTGLGLTISQDILKLMSSSIIVESTPRQGSTFTFSVWLRISENTPAQTPTQASYLPPDPIPELLGRKVMIVDDDPLNRMVAHDLLSTLGVTVILVESGTHILSRLAIDEPELIFMDLQMPDLDGYATMKLLQNDGRFTYIPVVALTAHTSSAEEHRCIQAGMINVITKPFNMNEIKNLLLSQLSPSSQVVG